VTINLSTRLAPFDFTSSRFDAAIHFGRADWPGAEHLALMPETVLAVGAPDVVTSDIPLHSQPLLHLETRPKGWARWLKAHGLPPSEDTGMVFDQFATMAQAAVHGLGLALLPTFDAEPYLDAGTLELAAPDSQDSIGSYYLVWPKNRLLPNALHSFQEWILKQSVSISEA
jgi:DNA-binding transcriptional LysR family regulator